MAKPRLLPWPFALAFVVVLAIGLAVALTRTSRVESAAYAAISGCAAHVIAKADDKVVDGLNDYFGMIQFGANRAELAHVLSMCETEPELARRVLRKGLDEGNKNAKIVALHCAFFLTQAPNGKEKGWLDAEDFARLVAHLDPAKEKDLDVRKVAQRASSDLTVLTDSSAEARYKVLPADLPPVTDENPPHKIATRELKVGDKTVLNIRWSDPDLAYAWWKANAGKGSWNQASQRFEIP